MGAIVTAALAFLAKLFGMWLNKTPTPIAEAEKVGAVQQQAADSQAQAKAEANIAQAEATAPTTVAAVVTELNQGTF